MPVPTGVTGSAETEPPRTSPGTPAAPLARSKVTLPQAPPCTPRPGGRTSGVRSDGSRMKVTGLPLTDWHAWIADRHRAGPEVANVRDCWHILALDSMALFYR